MVASSKSALRGYEVAVLAVESRSSVKTIERAYRGIRVSDNSRLRIVEAAKRKHLPLPPEPVTTQGTP